MSEQVALLTSDKVCGAVVTGMQEKKAENIVILDLKKIKNSVSDFFVICSGNSNPHIDAIAESVEADVYKLSGQNPWHKEGFENKTWVLLDYVDVVVHVFNKKEREFYELEKLWGDAIFREVIS